MQGTYIDSGAESGDASSTELVYTVGLAKSGSIQFTYTSDGERYYDYLHFYIDNVEQEIDSEYGCALRSLVVAIIRSSSVPSTHIAHAVQALALLVCRYFVIKDWRVFKSAAIPAGSHTFKWAWEKDVRDVEGADQARLRLCPIHTSLVRSPLIE